MLVAEKFTPEVMLSAPRRSPAVPNFDGTLALYTVSTHTFGDKTNTEARVMDIESGASSLVTDEEKVHDINWLPGRINDIIYLKSGDKGITEVKVTNPDAKDPYVITKIDAPIKSLKLKALDEGTIVFLVAGLVGKDGELFNDEAVESKSTAKVFDDFRVRSWDAYYKARKYSLWYTTLVKEDQKWKLSGDLLNLLQNSQLEAPVGVYDLADPLDGFDIGKHGIAFAASDPELHRPELNGTTTVYYVPLKSFTESPTAQAMKMHMPELDRAGLAYNVRISPDGHVIGFLYKPLANPAATAIILGYVSTLVAFDAYEQVIGGPPRMPLDGFEWAGSNDTLICTAEDCARTRLLRLELRRGGKTESLMHSGTIRAWHPLKEGDFGKLLVSSSSFMDSSLWQVVDVVGTKDPKVVSSATKHGAKFGLSHSMVSEFWYEGEDDIPVHSWMIKPSDFDETKKYPWILMPHGGPESSSMDAWSTRWNFALFAQQGYVVILPNVAGSTGFGVEFTARIYRSWGGAPLRDLERLVSYLEHLTFLDRDRAVLAGGSYGGYLISWMNGHDIIKKFSAAVWHDGIFSLPSFSMQTDYQTGGPDFNGAPFPWVNSEDLEMWNPARPELLKKWKNAPPTLVVHSEKDYRCPMTEGIATFQTLQAHGVPSRFLTFPDENHWVLNPENSLVWNQTVFEWLEKWVGKTGSQA